MIRGIRVVSPLVGRTPDEAHRASTPLELFFDLVFVVAIAQVSSELHHGLLGGNVGQTIFQYIFVFGAIWWAWMGFTWFASAFDTGDVTYRLTVLVQMTGALVLAAGVPRAFDQADWRLVLLGYVIMRLAGVTQCLRVARDSPRCRPAALRYATGMTVLQVLWVAVDPSQSVQLPGDGAERGHRPSGDADPACRGGGDLGGRSRIHVGLLAEVPAGFPDLASER